SQNVVHSDSDLILHNSSVLIDKEPIKKELTVPTLALCADDDNKTYRKRIVSSQTQTEKN
ncbi:hypothetical protein ACTMR0_12915, partial [Enterococcus faecium]